MGSYDRMAMLYAPAPPPPKLYDAFGAFMSGLDYSMPIINLTENISFVVTDYNKNEAIRRQYQKADRY